MTLARTLVPLERIETLLRARVADGHTPATAYALFDSDGVFASAGFGNTESIDHPVTSRTRFRIASCTKSFTAAAILQLRDRKELDLDAPLSDYIALGPLALLGRRVEAPTIRMLLSMRSGLPTDDPWADRQESTTQQDFDHLIAVGLSLATRPGTTFGYSNLAYALLGRLAEHVTGRPFVDVVRDGLLRPLQLAGISFSDDPHELVHGYARVGDRWVRQPFTRPGSFSAIGGLISSAPALAEWARWLLLGWYDDEEDDVLSRRSRREMQVAATPIPPPDRRQAYGYGLMIEQHQQLGAVASHSGGYPGYSSHMRWSLDRGVGIVVMENARYSGAEVPATEALDMVLAYQSPRPGQKILWPSTIRAQHAVEQFLLKPEVGINVPLADNLYLDRSEADRVDEAKRIRAVIGEPTPPDAKRLGSSSTSTSPAELSWTALGADGSVRCAISLTGHAEPQLQSIEFEDPVRRDGT